MPFRLLLSDDRAKMALPDYFAVIDGKHSANYLRAKLVPIPDGLEGSTKQLQKHHDSALSELAGIGTEPSELRKLDIPKKSLMDLKLELAGRYFQSCNFCERECGVDRRSKKGTCGVLGSKITSEFLHHGEEPELVPSHTIFFAGCTFKCVFCQNYDISQSPDKGMSIPPEKLAEIIEVHANRARNTNWVGGDPTSNLKYILEVLAHLEKNIPQVWNSNMYLTESSMELLDGVMDLYLTDFKYGPGPCAQGAPRKSTTRPPSLLRRGRYFFGLGRPLP